MSLTCTCPRTSKDELIYDKRCPIHARSNSDRMVDVSGFLQVALCECEHCDKVALRKLIRNGVPLEIVTRGTDGKIHHYDLIKRNE